MMNKQEFAGRPGDFYLGRCARNPIATAGHAWTLDENKRDTADRAC